MQYPEDASKAAAYLREAIPLMVKHAIEPNPRNFSLWYAYVAKSNLELNVELDAILAEHNTCPAIQSTDLFRRYIIDDEVDFSHKVQTQLSKVIGNLSAQSSTMSEGNQQYDTFLEQGLENLQQQLSENDIKSLLSSLLEQTRQTSEITQKFQNQMAAANQEIGSLREEMQSVQKEASLDGLTRISNRGAFDKELQQQIDKQSSGTTNTLCLVVTDIDHFKRCNDKYGHVMGDKILQSFAKILNHICQDIGFCARYGGEEFAIILPNHTLEQGCAVAEKIRATTERMKIKQRNQEEFVDQLTTSLGVALYNSGESATAFIERTDSSLYKAKESGRNRVIAEHHLE
ncbi:MAG: GGDEF domain-containing protein [Pseudomonadales bacterium]